MSFFANLFRRKDAAFYLERARTSLERKEWVAARDAAEDGLGRARSDAERKDLEQALSDARAGICELNMGEAALSAEAGELERATDLLMVAMDNAPDERTRRDIQREMDKLERRAVRRERSDSAGTERRGPGMLTVQAAAGQADDSKTPEIFEIYLAGLEPTVAEAFRRLGPDFAHGYVALNEGEGKKAVTRLGKVTPDEKTAPWVNFEKARAALMVGMPREALGLLQGVEQAIGHTSFYLSGQPSLAELMSEAYMALKEEDKALEAVRAGLDHDPDALGLRVSEVTLLARAQRHGEGAQILDEQIKKTPKQRELYLLYHQLELARNDPQKAAAVLEAGMSRCCGSGACSAADREIPRALATFYLKREENPKRVESLLNQLFLGQGGEGEWFDHYLRARFYRWQNDDARARRNWEVALKKCPEDDPRYHEIKSLYAA